MLIFTGHSGSEFDVNGINFLDRLEARHEMGTAIVLLVLVQVEGTPFAGQPTLDPLDFVRTFAVTGGLFSASITQRIDLKASVC